MRVHEQSFAVLGRHSLDCKSTWDTPPAKPKWMRWRTYERKYELWERVIEKADEEFVISAKRLLKRL